MKWLGKINFDNRPQYDAEGLITESEVDTISGSLNTKISAKPDTLLELSDTPAVYDDNKYLKATTSGVEWATVSGGTGTSDHSELSSLAYAVSGHTGFQPSGDYATDSELTSVSGALQTNIDGKSDTGHTHDDRYYTESEVDTISGSLQTNIDGKADTVHTHDDRYYTESEVDTISGSLQTNIDGKSDTGHTHDDRYYTETEVDTISGSLNTKIAAKPDTLLELSDTPAAYDDNKYLKSTTSGTEWATVSGGTGTSIHSELSNLDYASSGHTGFQPSGDYVTDSEFSTYSGTLQSQIDGKSDTGHSHTESDISDLDKYTQNEVDTISGSLQTNIDGKSDTGHTHDDRYYTEAEVDTISGSLNTKIEAKPDTLLELSDTPAAYDDNKYLKSTTSGTEWATVSGGTGTSDHSELSNLDYASAGHTGQLSIGENDLKLDALLSADGKYSGTTRDGVLGATLAYGDLVYLNTTDQRWELADADAETTSGDVDLAIVLASGDDGDTRLLLTDGYVREDDWNFTSYGQALFISTTSGTMTQAVVSGTGDIVRVVGKAGTTANEIRFKPSETWIELS